MVMYTIGSELYQGKSIGRTLLNLQINAKVHLRGQVLDIGGRGTPSYHRFFLEGEPHRMIRLDIENEQVEVVGSALQLPFASGSLDVVLCFNVLEHIFDYSHALREMARAIRIEGVLYGYIPFLVPVHMEPFDYWRYTKDAMDQILREAGFGSVSIATIGGLPLVVYDMLSPLWRIGLFRVSIGLLALTIDKFSALFVGKERNSARYPLGYFFEARHTR